VSAFGLCSRTSKPDIFFLLPVLCRELRYNAFLSRTSTHKVLLSKSGMKVKVFRLELDDGLNDKVLLSTKHPIREDSLQLRDRTLFYLKESLQALEHGL
jgi:hypothetical protein